MLKKLLVFSFLAFFAVVFSVSAHNPRIVQTDSTKVSNPEISQAFYDELEGSPRTYQINSDEEFELYLSLTVPDSSNPEGRYSLKVYELAPNGERSLLYDLFADEKEWESFNEIFAGDLYWQGPKYREMKPAGVYEVEVYNENNQGKYVLAIGAIEYFPWPELVNSIKIIPDLKKDFFEVPKADFLFSVFGATYVILMFAFGFLIGLVSYLLYKYLRKNKKRKICNMGKMDRILRFLGAVIFFTWGIFWSWHPLLFILSGFMIFAVLSKFCVLFLLIKRNTCK